VVNGGVLNDSLYKATATEDNIKELLQVIANAAVSDLNREDAAWALRVMTEPALAQRKRNTGLLINLGAVDPLVDMLVNGATHGCKEQVRVRMRAGVGVGARAWSASAPFRASDSAPASSQRTCCDIQARGVSFGRETRTKVLILWGWVGPLAGDRGAAQYCSGDQPTQGWPQNQEGHPARGGQVGGVGDTGVGCAHCGDGAHDCGARRRVRGQERRGDRAPHGGEGGAARLVVVGSGRGCTSFAQHRAAPPEVACN